MPKLYSAPSLFDGSSIDRRRVGYGSHNGCACNGGLLPSGAFLHYYRFSVARSLHPNWRRHDLSYRPTGQSSCITYCLVRSAAIALCVRWDQLQDRLVLSLRFRWCCSMTSFGSLLEMARVGLHLSGQGIWDPHASLVRVYGTPSYLGFTFALEASAR